MEEGGGGDKDNLKLDVTIVTNLGEEHKEKKLLDSFKIRRGFDLPVEDAVFTKKMEGKSCKLVFELVELDFWNDDETSRTVECELGTRKRVVLFFDGFNVEYTLTYQVDKIIEYKSTWRWFWIVIIFGLCFLRVYVECFLRILVACCKKKPGQPK
mmetsp:Transcript_2001/g.2978  ORF Transcript_2001/g.2978 Transcript_2001/m.2978 type:complete len:155 (+) Transcript_2001:153-617(+)